MTLPTDPQAIAERCWETAMSWLLAEAYIVHAEVPKLRELYTCVLNETESAARIRERVVELVKSPLYSEHGPRGSRVIRNLEAVGMLGVIARGRP